MPHAAAVEDSFPDHTRLELLLLYTTKLLNGLVDQGLLEGKGVQLMPSGQAIVARIEAWGAETGRHPFTPDEIRLGTSTLQRGLPPDSSDDTTVQT